MRDRDDILKELAPLVESMYQRNSGGCCLHALIDDGNWDAMYDEDMLEHDDCRKAHALIHELDMFDRELLEHDGGQNLRFIETEYDDGYGEDFNAYDEEEEEEEEEEESDEISTD